MVSRIGKYKIQSQVGEGGSGRVYLALDPVVGRKVAIKVLTAPEDADTLSRFRSEAATTGNLRHPNIVAVYDFGEQEGVPYLVFEFLEGQTLQRLISGKSPLTMLEKVRILVQMADGLSYAHSQGIIHRDIKPANVMVLQDGTIKLMDFGIARGSHDRNRLTQSGFLIGTINYMAPEQFAGDDVDEQSDIFAFGVTAYELIAGKNPFAQASSDPARVMYAVMNQEPQPLQEAAPDCPLPLAAVVHHALAKDPAARYPSSKELLFDLQPVLHELQQEQLTELLSSARGSMASGAFESAQASVQTALEMFPADQATRILRKDLQAEIAKRSAKRREETSDTPSAEPPKPPPSQPGEFTRMFGGPSEMPGPPPAVVPPKQGDPTAVNEFTNFFNASRPAGGLGTGQTFGQPPVKPANPPLAGPGEFTAMFGPPPPKADSSGSTTGSFKAPEPPTLPSVEPRGAELWQWLLILAAGVAIVIGLVVSAQSSVFGGTPWILSGAVWLLAWFLIGRKPRVKPTVDPINQDPGEHTVLQPRPKLPQLNPQPPDRPPIADATSMFARSDLSPNRVTGIALLVTGSGDPAMIGTTVPIDRFPFRIGRTDADLSLPADRGVSQVHAIIEFSGGRFLVRDPGSSNGTYLDGKLLTKDQPHPLPFGSCIQLSQTTTLVFHSREMQLLPDLTGAVIAGRFTLQELLYSSQKSVTYAASDRNLSSRVALKLLSPHLMQFPGYSEQFRNEALSVVGLRHPNICRVLDFGETDIPLPGQRPAHSHYLCVELMSGGNLAKALNKEGGITPQQALSWIQQTAEALDYAHSRGVIHAGLKPSSLVFDELGNVLLTDFASASRQGAGMGWSVSGAPAFMAPEQWDGKEATNSTDQYSLAVLAYLLLTGSRPYEAQENPEVRRRNFARGPLPAHEEAAQNGKPPMPAAVSEVLRRGLATAPANRFQSTAEFAAELQQAFLATGPKVEKLPKVFISYLRETSAGWANLFADKLREKHNVLAFVDVRNMDNAGSFPDRIRKEIEASDYFVCFLAEPTLESVWVQREIQIAHDSRRTMIPVFQESFRQPGEDDTTEPGVKALLNCQGVHLFDRLNIHIDHSVADLARIIRTGAA